MMNLTFLLLFVISTIICINNSVHCQRAINNNRISRLRGNILRNITQTHEFDDNIVTSQLDASVGIRQFYRNIRDIYNRFVCIFCCTFVGYFPYQSMFFQDFLAVQGYVVLVVFYKVPYRNRYHSHVGQRDFEVNIHRIVFIN